MKPDGAAERIARHRRRRAGKGFMTVERQRDLVSLELPRGSTALLECLSNLLANEMFDAGGDYAGRVKAGLLRLIESCSDVVIVSNDVFSDGAVYGCLTEEYRRALAELNRFLAAIADRVTETAAGVTIAHKGTLKC